jgi:predicted dehydrogenase
VTLRWGFLGASRIGRRALAPAVAAASGHALHAVGARDLDRARAFADAFDAARCYGGYQQLIDDPGLDAIYIALPNDAHLPWTVRALQAGKHVLCEKPLALTAAEVRQMLAAEQQSGRRVMEAFCHIAHPQVPRAMQMITGGAIGSLVAIEATYGMTTDRADPYRWTKHLGGGALYDIGCYCVSIMRVLSGREPVRAAAVAAMDGEVDASLTGLLDFGDGVAARFTCSYVSAYTQQVTLIGSKGVLTLETPFGTKNRVTRIFTTGGVEEFAAIDPYVAMLEAFGRAVRGEEAMRHDLAWSLRQAEALDALRAAAASGAMVSLSR